MIVVIVTDNGFAAEAIRRSFRGASGVKIAGYVDGRRPCVSAVAATQPDVILVDEMTWSESAINRIRELSSAIPGAKVIALTSEPAAPWLADAVRAGAHAAISKTVQPAVLSTLVKEIHASTVYHAFQPATAPAAKETPHAFLTPRELEILRLVAAGDSNSVIARELWVTEQTVKFHLSNVYRKLGVANRTGAAHYAHIHDLVGDERLPGRLDDRRAA
jgi:DNA-binding NarL/FixJ family response regulator